MAPRLPEFDPHADAGAPTPRLRLRDHRRQSLTIRFDGRPVRVMGGSAATREKVLPTLTATKKSGAEKHRAPLPSADPRWVLATRAAQVMSGAVLRPADRAELVRMGKLLGISAFQANLIIAIVQDQARRGQPLGGAAELIAMVAPEASQPTERTGWGWRVAAWCAVALLLEATVVIFLVN